MIPSLPTSSLPRDDVPQAPAASATVSTKNDGFWGEDGFTFGDVLDAINPLKQLPIVSDIYAKISGNSNDISAGSRMIGGALIGGFAGILTAFTQTTIRQETGNSITGHVLAQLTPETNTAEEIAAHISHSETVIKEEGLIIGLLSHDPDTVRAKQMSEAIALYKLQTGQLEDDDPLMELVS